MIGRKREMMRMWKWVKTKSKTFFFKYPCVCLCVHVSQVTKICVDWYLCVLFSEFIVRLPTNTHLGTLIQISHHTHTPPCRYTSTPALSLFGMPPFTANLPSRLVMPLSPSPNNYVPARPPFPPPPLPPLPAIHNKLRDHLLWLQSTDWQAVLGVW